MTRPLPAARRPRRITQPIVVVRRPRDPAIDDLGFSCFRLVPTLDDDAPFAPLAVERSRHAMFAFVRAR